MIMSAALADPPSAGTRLEGASMNAYAVIAGLSGLAVFCAVAFKGFGQPR
jgi:hypothetical protein